jgi:peptidoglycan/xylan/chitin deacetylase (PgdA/CDA1 family)
MKVPKRRTMLHAAAWLTSRVRPGPIILGYHRVADCEWDPEHLCVGVRNFSQQLDVLRQCATPISLRRLHGELGSGTLSRRTVAITFDDGYSDTFDVAAPLLHKYEIPATVFVVSGSLGKRFWWDDVRQIVDSADTLPARVCIEAGNDHFRWNGGANTRENRTSLVRELGHFFRSTENSMHSFLRDRLRETLGVHQERFELPRAVGAETLGAAAQSGLIEVGSHTSSHVSLGHLSRQQQEQQLRSSRQILEDITGRAVRSFSYPNGIHSADTPGIAAKLGYEYACTSAAGVLHPKSNPYLLPRLWVGDWDGDRFASWLKRWLK